MLEGRDANPFLAMVALYGLENEGGAVNKEEIYDDQIGPLMARIIEICKEHKISLIADFGLDDNDDLHCTTALLSPEFNPMGNQLNALELLRPKAGHALAIATSTAPDGTKQLSVVRLHGLAR